MIGRGEQTNLPPGAERQRGREAARERQSERDRETARERQSKGDRKTERDTNRERERERDAVSRETNTLTYIALTLCKKKSVCLPFLNCLATATVILSSPEASRETKVSLSVSAFKK